MTHSEAVRRIANWLRFTKRSTVVMAELRTAISETPDVLAWHGAGASILVECKVSRNDFFGDAKKSFRHYEELGVGDLRYYATPPDLIKPSELPEGWGLLSICEHRICTLVEPKLKQANKRNEVKMLMSAIRRLEISTAVFVQSDVFVNAVTSEKEQP